MGRDADGFGPGAAPPPGGAGTKEPPAAGGAAAFRDATLAKSPIALWSL